MAGRRIATMQARSHNIDGEALLQVALLAARRPEAHRHLLTLSDGHPEGSCHEQLLATHLRDVAAMAAAAGVDVTAVGIRTEAVKLYHPRWLVIHKLEDLAPALVGLATRALRAAPGRRRR